MNDQPTWSALKNLASRQLAPDLSARVLARADRARHQRREFSAMAATLTLCVLLTGGLFSWQTHRENQRNLAEWREVSAITVAIEQNL